jgi:hypothetical protein
LVVTGYSNEMRLKKGRRLSSLTEEGSVTVLHVRASLDNGFL